MIQASNLERAWGTPERLNSWLEGCRARGELGTSVRIDFELVKEALTEIKRLNNGIEEICHERATSPITRARLRHLTAGVDWRKAR